MLRTTQMNWCSTLGTSMLALVLAVASFEPAHAGDGSLARVKKAGKVIVAADPTYPPMESEGASGKLEGYDIELAQELGKRLGVTAEIQAVAWEGIIPGLFAKRYDLVISAMNITEERKKQVNFVEYAKIAQLYVSRKGTKVATEKDLANKIVAVQADTSSAEFLEKQKKAGIQFKDIRAIPSADKTFEALKANQADVVVSDEPVARFFTKANPNLFEITGQAMTPEPIGIALRKGDAELQAAVESAIQEMKKDGFIKKLNEKWFGADLGGS